MDIIKKLIGSIYKVDIENLDLKESFTDFAGKFAHVPGTVVLMSGGSMDCANYHILGIKPWLTFYGQGQNMNICLNNPETKPGFPIQSFKADPFDTLRHILKTFRLENPDLPFPIASGLMGYLSYDLKDALEKLPRTSIDDLCLPQIWFTAPSAIIIHDIKKDETRICIPRFKNRKKNENFISIEYVKKIIEDKNTENQSGFHGNSYAFKSNFTRPAYVESIKKIKDYISAGHVYQVNMSQKFTTDFSGNPFSLFQSLYKLNPAPFFAYINAGDHQIVSTSPERFIMQDNKYVETRPIKGTRPRGKTPEEDTQLAQELENSKKDDAELSMIVDLMRNDIGKVCKPSSVRVTQHKRLEPYQNVWHLVSIVEGTLDDDKDSVDLVKATFPGGSITGCPKIRSMEIIDELEPNRRHIYTGSIGYLSFHNTMDLSIAIRTATIYNNKIIFSVGGGIVFDSDPGDEYEETLHKGQSLINVFQGKQNNFNTGTSSNIAWFNGTLQPLNQVNIPAAHPGVQYGFGFFETIRVENNKPGFLKEHMDRFDRTWKYFFKNQNPPDLSWDEIISQVICVNRLENKTCAVKIMVFKGDRETPPYNESLVVTARPYVHRLSGKDQPGLDIVTYPFPRQTPLADHKTLNYLYYLQAGIHAKNHGADEALILNPDNSISETNTANIFIINQNKVTAPASPHVLPGIMAQAVCKFLLRAGYEMENEKISQEELFNADTVFLTNSLMGAVPVLSIDYKPVSPCFDMCKEINNQIL